MILDGCTMVSTSDNFLYHEMISHPAMFTHPNPKKSLDYWRRRMWDIAGSVEA